MAVEEGKPPQHGQQLELFVPSKLEKARPKDKSNEDIMTLNLQMPDITELKPKITVCGVGGAGGNAVNNMIKSGLEGVEFVVANTDAQALSSSQASRLIQMGLEVTEGLGAGSQPDVGRQAAEEVIDEINDYLEGSHMAFITAGMGGGTGTGAAPVVARAARDKGILTVGVVTKPFQFEGARRMRLAESGIEELQANVDTLIVIPNQNLFRIANEKTTFSDAFSMADQVLYSGVACITDLMVKEGLINLDFADVRSVMREMGKAMMGTGEASGDRRAIEAAEAAIANPLLDETSMQGAQGLLISITGGNDLTLFEVDEAATRIREEVDPDANIILGATFDETLDGIVRVSVVATGIDGAPVQAAKPIEQKPTDSFMRKAENDVSAKPAPAPAPAPQMAKPAMPAVKPVATPDPAVMPAVTKSPIDQAVASAVIEAALEINEPAPQSAPVQPAPQQPAMAQTAKSDPAVTIEPIVPGADAHKLPESARIIPDISDLTATPTVAPIDEPVLNNKPFIPPVAEKPVIAPRIPTLDDFPKMIQEEAENKSPLAKQSQEERGAMGLLKRITNATLGASKQEDDKSPILSGSAEALAEIERATMATAPQPVKAPAPAQPVAQPTAASNLFGKPAQERAPLAQPGQNTAQTYAPAQGKLDAQGRPQANQSERNPEDQLEIPAFLRRQVN